MKTRRPIWINFITLTLFMLMYVNAFSQTDTTARCSNTYTGLRQEVKRSIGIVVGGHFFKYGFGEFGVGLASNEWGNHGSMFHAATLSVEWNRWNKVYGYKLSVWKNIPMIPISLGINGVYHRENILADYSIRPMLGVGVAGFQLVYSYDFPLDKRDISTRNTHMFSLRYFYPIVKI